MLKIHKLSNNLRIVAEKADSVKSFTLGIWIKAGSRNENLINNGISHFIEHMLFKGTKKRTALELAEAIDNTSYLMEYNTKVMKFLKKKINYDKA